MIQLVKDFLIGSSGISISDHDAFIATVVFSVLIFSIIFSLISLIFKR